MGFKPQQLAVIGGISLLVSALVVYLSNNNDTVEDTIG
jgi:hypothetical protein